MRISFIQLILLVIFFFILFQSKLVTNKLNELVNKFLKKNEKANSDKTKIDN